MDETLAGALIGGGMIFLSGLLVMWLAGRMAAGRFKRNKWAGIRTPSTMKSDEAWAVAHEAGAPLLSIGGTIGAAGGLTSLTAALMGAGDGLVFGLIMGGALGMAAFAIAGTVKGARAAREVD